MAYSELTTNSPSRIKRWSHGSRFTAALNAIPITTRHSIADYGAGDGYLLYLAAEQFRPAEMWAFEPFYADQAREQLGDRARIVTEPAALPDNRFDRVYCMEVLEHLRSELVDEALSNIRRILKGDGAAVITVPIEVGPASLFKNLVRVSMRKPHNNTSLSTVANSVLGRMRSIPRSESNNYISSHIGFDFRKLPARFAAHGLRLERKVYSPLSAFGAVVNSQVTFVLGRVGT